MKQCPVSLAQHSMSATHFESIAVRDAREKSKRDCQHLKSHKKDMGRDDEEIDNLQKHEQRVK